MGNSPEEVGESIGEERRVLRVAVLSLVDLLLKAGDLALGQPHNAIKLGPLGCDLSDRPVCAVVVGDPEGRAADLVAGSRGGVVPGEINGFDLLEGDDRQLLRLRGVGLFCRSLLLSSRLGDGLLCFVAHWLAPFSAKKRCPPISMTKRCVSCHSLSVQRGA